MITCLNVCNNVSILPVLLLICLTGVKCNTDVYGLTITKSHFLGVLSLGEEKAMAMVWGKVSVDT